jgi:hypothetical protein
MTSRSIKNVASSVRQRLLNLAHERGEDFNLLLTRGSTVPFVAPLGLTDAFALAAEKAQQ